MQLWMDVSGMRMQIRVTWPAVDSECYAAKQLPVLAFANYNNNVSVIIIVSG